MTHQPCIAELLRLAAEEGLELPLPVEVIAAHEQGGHVVDLVTGEVIEHGADQRVLMAVTGQAQGWEAPGL